MGSRGTTNLQIAQALDEVALLMDVEGEDPFRARAWRIAARTIADLDVEAARLLAEGGRDALVELPGIGPSLASAIEELCRTGRCATLERLRARMPPPVLFLRVPGIGPDLARRIYEELGLESLEELELAAHDGTLERVPGIGPRRARAVRDHLAVELGRPGPPHLERRARERPPVGLILAVDDEYRREGQKGSLKKVAPRRFNPDRIPWLPILHVERGGWTFTALFSNTAAAHKLGRVGDWVVLLCARAGRGDAEQRCTVVTETKGALKGRRVVRGREAECARHYAPELSLGEAAI